MVFYLTENIIEEAVSGQQVVDALNNRQGVLINYSDEEASHPGRRYIEPYVYGLTKAGNPCIRAYQYYGDTKRGVPKWKLFRLDRIDSWEPTQQTFNLEPKARGWAAQAYNDNGDGSMSQVFQTVELGEEPLTDLERLRAKTRQLQQSKPLTIDQFKDRLQYPEERNKERQIQQQQTQKPQPAQPGPIDSTKPESITPSPVQDTSANNVSNPLQGNGEVKTDVTQPPIKKEPNQSGPVIDVQKEKPEDLMSNDAFKSMLQRNLQISQQEKERRDKKRALKNQPKP